MSRRHVQRVARRCRKSLQIDKFLCYFDLEICLPFISLIIAVPCCILAYHDAVFLWRYMRERTDEEVKSGRRSPEVFEFVKCCELVVFLLSTVLSFFMLYVIDNKVINILRSCVICSMTLTLVVFVEGILRSSANLIAFFAFNFYYTLCIYSIFKKFCRELYQQRLQTLEM